MKSSAVMMFKEHVRVKDDTLTALQYVVLGSILLYFGREIFIPLSFALLISFVIYPSCKWLEKRGFRRMTAILVNIILLLIALTGIVVLLVNQFLGFLQEWPMVQGKLMESLKNFSRLLYESYGVSKEQQNKLISQVFNGSGSGAFELFVE